MKAASSRGRCPGLGATEASAPRGRGGNCDRGNQEDVGRVALAALEMTAAEVSVCLLVTEQTTGRPRRMH